MFHVPLTFPPTHKTTFKVSILYEIMASFAVTVEGVTIRKHPNADRLELANVLGYVCVVPKDAFQTGDLAAYIPEQSIVPAAILEEMGLAGRLAGPNADRVRAQRLRGVLSQGLLYSGKLLPENMREGDDVTNLLGITKWEPPIPDGMGGRVERWNGRGKLIGYDIEDVKRHPGRMRDGETVVMTEKIHGTLCYLAYDVEWRASSKGYAAKQLVFAPSVDNVYTRALRENLDGLNHLVARLDPPIHVIGEVYGPGIQDLQYGGRGFRVFDVMSAGAYLDHDSKERMLEMAGVAMVPVIYRGPFSAGALESATSGASTLPGAGHMREGAVVRPVVERTDTDGRVILKSVSPAYLTRRGKVTEFN